MLRAILGTLAGVVVFVVFVVAGDGIASVIHPPPPGFDYNDPEHLKQHMQGAPLAAVIGLVVAYAVGAFVGGWVAGLIGRHRVPVMIVTLIALLACGANIYFVGHDIWFAVVNLVTVLAGGWLGFQVATALPGRAAKG
jgi:ribose/xylose/arabinose/galactoside ABC-type transport system permease subunit